MATNHYFSQKVKSEQNLYEDIIIESLKIYGQDVYYLPRDLVTEDKILGEDIQSSFNSSYKVEMYIENTEGFDGEGDLFTKFGVEIRDQATFIVARKRWSQTVARYDNEIQAIRPLEGDVIYLPLSNSMFQIMAVEHEQPFYQLSNLPTYKLRCELFEYSGENLDTGVDAIDTVERDYAYKYLVTLDSASFGWSIGETVNQTLSTGTIVSGEVAAFSDSDNILHLIHVGADDGNYHTFVTGRQIIGTEDKDSSGSIVDPLLSIASATAVSEVNQLAENEKNDFFDTTDTDMGFLDFSESNPFGDPQ
jgi:hypothetical protein